MGKTGLEFYWAAHCRRAAAGKFVPLTFPKYMEVCAKIEREMFRNGERL